MNFNISKMATFIKLPILHCGLFTYAFRDPTRSLKQIINFFFLFDSNIEVVLILILILTVRLKFILATPGKTSHRTALKNKVQNEEYFK